MPVPDSYKLSDAAAIPEVWLTAYQLLHFLGKVQSGEVVLVHAGGSGVGTALVQLSRLAGAVPYVTAGSEKKIKMAESLGAEGGFNYKTGNFSSWIENVTGGNSIDFIFVNFSLLKSDSAAPYQHTNHFICSIYVLFVLFCFFIDDTECCRFCCFFFCWAECPHVALSSKENVLDGLCCSLFYLIFVF